MSSRVLRGAVGKGVQVHAQARRRWVGESKCLQGPERGGGHGHVVMCPGLQRAVACESMPAEPRGVSGSVGADVCRGQVWEVSIEFRFLSRSFGHMSAGAC